MPPARRPPTIVIGVDTGGTFTDFICFTRGALRVHKRPSTPRNPADAVLAGLRELLGADALQRASITYGSTVATNAVLERRGARVVLLTTDGLQDVLEIGRQRRPDLYALEPQKPEPLVPRARRIGVAERLTVDGQVLQMLSAGAIRRAGAPRRRAGAESIALCLLPPLPRPRPRPPPARPPTPPG